MKEFLYLIRTQGDPVQSWSPEQHQQHIQKVIDYIRDLVRNGKLKSAQPLDMEGTIISNTKGTFKDGPFNETKEVIAGYYLIRANDLKEAIEIAKANPILEDATGARVEVRPILVVEGING